MAHTILEKMSTSEENKRTAHYHFQYGVKLLKKRKYERGLEELLIAKNLVVSVILEISASKLKFSLTSISSFFIISENV